MFQSRAHQLSKIHVQPQAIALQLELADAAHVHRARKQRRDSARHGIRRFEDELSHDGGRERRKRGVLREVGREVEPGVIEADMQPVDSGETAEDGGDVRLVLRCHP